MKNKLLDQLNQLISETNLNICLQQQTLLVEYVIMLHRWNNVYNLTSVRDPNQMLIKHIMDSLMISTYLKGDYFIDIGTGPGLPGIPLAIINPEKKFYLLDSLRKRITFLKQVSYQLKLNNVITINSRAENFIIDPCQLNNRKFDGILSRAFSSLNQFIKTTDHLLDEEGSFYALKGIYNEQEIKELPPVYEVYKTYKIDVPSLNGERHLICIKKIIEKALNK